MGSTGRHSTPEAGEQADGAPAARYALLADGSTVEIRHATAADADDVREMHAQMSPDNAYFRFFSFSPQAPDREARRICRPAGPDHAALLARLNDKLVGVASYEPVGRPGVAEIAFAVSDEMHGRGVATLLLEHLVSLARQRHLTAFAAETLPENLAMQKVFAAAGLPVQRQFADGLVELRMPLPGHEGQQLDSYLEAVAGRASRAEAASLRHLLRPASVAVVGAGRRRGSVGREILHNIVTGGFTGPVYAVNPHGQSMEGLHCLASADDLPRGVDLAVITVPASEVSGVAAQCGRRGVRALVVITSGLGSAGADLLAICRRYGMRLVGPNCFGVAAPAAALNATFTAAPPVPGAAGLVVQSGGVGVALLEHLGRLGIGISSFASVGDKYDVSSNDMLTWWEQDELTRLAVLYVESFGNPRAFARTARRVGKHMPVLTVIGGRSQAGQRAAASLTAASAPSLTQEALFGQAGITATDSLGELVETAALLSCQLLPAGRRVAIVSNAGAAGVLAADACVDNGLTVAGLDPVRQRRLARLLPPGAAVSGPVDTTAQAAVDAFRSCLEEVASDPGVDALLAIEVPTAIGDLGAAIRTSAVAKPLAAVLLEQPEAVSIVGGERRIPCYSYPEGAARALAHAARRREWLDGQRGTVPEFADVDSAGARAMVSAFLAASPDGGWIATADAAQILASYQISLSAGSARDMADGVGTVISVVQEPVFGPLVVFGLRGVATEVLDDRAARLTPLTDVDAEALIRAVRAAPLLFGHQGSPAVDVAALADLLMRVSRLADDIPEIAELDLNPVIARPDSVTATDVRIKVTPAAPADPFLRQLR
jgi:acyl-CoA synthetase (NDP forming)/RimJ/RimL family protein N-acetyltransferase